MADLRAICSDLGYASAVTYLQSGNVVLSTSNPDAVEDDLSRAILDRCGLSVPVVTRSAFDLEQVVDRAPWTISPGAGRLHHVVFLSAAPGLDRVEAMRQVDYGADTWLLDGRDLYVHYASGAGTTKLTAAAIERRLAVVATGRNWNTVVKMADLTASATA